MSNKQNKWGYALDLVEDFIVDKTQDSPDNYSAQRDINQIEADQVTDDGDIVNIEADNVTKEGDIIEGDQNNYYISISSCKPESDSPIEVNSERDIIVNDAPLSDAKDLGIESPPDLEFDFEIGG